MPTQVFDKTFGGITPGNLYVKPGELTYVENLDITKYSDRVVGGETYSNEVLTNGNKMLYITTAYGVLGSSKSWFFGEGGQVYNDTSSDNIPDRTYGVANSILDGTHLLGKIFLLQTSGNSFIVSSVDEQNASTGSLSGINENALTFNAGVAASTDNMGIESYSDGKLIVHRGTNIHAIKITAGVLGEDATIDVGKTIAGVTTATSNIKVYTNDGDIILYNAAYQRVSTVRTNIPLLGVKTINNIDVCVGNKGVYQTNGNSLVPFFQNYTNDIKGFIQTDLSYPIIGFDGTKLYFNTKWGSSEVGITTMGSDIIGYPEAISVDATKLGSDAIGQVVTYGLGKFHIYVSVIIGGVEQIIKKGLFKNNNVSGTVYLEKFNAGDNSTNKQLSEIRINGKFSNSKARVVYDGVESVNSLTLNNGGFRTEVVKGNDFSEPWSSLVIKIELDGGDEYYGAAIDYSPNNN